MPTKERAVKPESSLQLLTSIRGSATWKLAPRSSQSLLAWAIKTVANLVDGNNHAVTKSQMH
eukprot:8224251-Lingulodinium_polyedra.AAC.1